MPCQEHGFHGVSAIEAATLRALAAPKDFATADTPEQYPPDVPVDWQELTLVVEVDVLGRRITGTATYEGTVRRTEVKRLRFDADGIEILRAFDGSGEPLGCEHDGRTLWLDPGRVLQRGENIRIAIDFDTREPRAGFYFILPDEHHPHRVAHAWTQGQDEDSRFWFPCHDSPNHKLRVHVLATVPEAMTALSNGVLRDIYKAAQPGWRIFDWQMARPIPTYLLTLAIGPFVEVRQEEEPIPVSYFVLPGREADGQRAFGRTHEMIKHFEFLLGVRYPFEKYAQVAVEEFVFGGMENASMTTQTDLTLHDARAHLDFSSEPLVSHELAHQWFGDLVTCRTWSHGWLNEGFATYFELLWREHADGKDEFDYARQLYQRSYLLEDASRYRRTIVTNRYKEPIDVFDSHLYEKGGSVLHMLRQVLGDATFFAGLGTYLQAHADGSVETPDLRRALEKYSGTDLGRFFSQWVENGKGHPELKLGGSWDAETRQYKITVEQVQDTASAPLFHLQLAVEAHVEGQAMLTRTFKVERKEQSFYLDLPAQPSMILCDPHGDLLAVVEWGFGDAMHRTVLKEATQAVARIQAAIALGKHANTQNTEALRTALLTDPAWMVQAEVARALGKVGTTLAFQALSAGLAVAHPKARRAVATALGRFQTGEAAAVLARKLLEGDASYFVEAECAHALGATRQKTALPALEEALRRPSWNDTIAAGALDGLAALQDPAAIALAAPLLTPDRPTVLRCAAVRCLASLVTEPARVLDVLGPYAADPSFRVALTLASALGGLGDARAVGLLQTVADRASDGRVRKRAEESIAQIRAGLAAGKQVEGLRSDLDALRNQQRELLERVDRSDKLRGTAG